MTTRHSITMLAAMLVAGSAAAAWAQPPCPAEVGEAEKLLASIKVARPARSAASARTQDVQAPRAQDVQAPRAQDVQAPRGDRAAMRTRSATVETATRLVREARKACNTTDMPRATANARAALELLHYLE